MKASQGTATYDFNFIGLPLTNVQWSWGGENDDVVALRVWQDETSKRDGRIMTLLWHAEKLKAKDGHQDRQGAKERLRHIQSIRDGKRFLIIICRNEGAEDIDGPRKITFSKNRPHFMGGELVEEDNGNIWAVLPYRFKDRNEARTWVQSGNAA